MMRSKGIDLPKNVSGRFSVFMPKELIQGLDTIAQTQGHANRSKVLAGLVRAAIVENESHSDKTIVAGTLTMVYDHHKRNLLSRLTDTQHSCQEMIIACMHVHLDHHNCMEVLALRGVATDLRDFANKISALKGLKHCKLTLTTTGKGIIA